MNRIFYVLIGLTIISVSLSVYVIFSRPKIAYVRSHDLVNNFEGTIQARQAFEKKKAFMMGNVDSLRLLYEKNKMSFNASEKTMSVGQRNQKMQQLDQQQTQLYQYSQAVDQKIAEEDNRMMGEVLNQINSFVEDYAETYNLDVIFGTTLSGSLLYGDKAMDVTDQLLIELNDRYKGN